MNLLKLLAKGSGIGMGVAVLFSTFQLQAITPDPVPVGQVVSGVTSVAHGDTKEFVFYVHFDSDQSVIKNVYATLLDEVVRIVQSSGPTRFKVQVEGHTDSVGTDSYNLHLSQRRSAAVKKYLLTKPGLVEAGFKVEFFGESKPQASNETSQGKALNRRVRVVVSAVEKALKSQKFAHLLDITPDGKGFALGKGATLNYWKTELACPQKSFVAHDAAVTSVAFSPKDGRIALTGGSDHKVVLWDMATGTEIRHLLGHTDAVQEVAFSIRDVRQAISAGLDGRVMMWDLETGKQRPPDLEGHPGGVNTVAYDLQGRYFISGGQDGVMKYWDSSNGELIQTVPSNGFWVTSVAFISKEQFLSATGDGTIRLIQLNHAPHPSEVLRSYVGHTGPVKSLAVAPDGQSFLSAGMDGHIFVWNVLSGQKIASMAGHVGGVNYINYLDKSAQRALSFGNDDQIKMWRVADGQLLRTFAVGEEIKERSPPPSDPKAGEKWIEPITGMAFSWVPGGCYQMGCGIWSDSCSAGDKPVHEVCVSGYWLGQNEVTNGQWQKIMGGLPDMSGPGDELPVTRIGWEEAQDFICRLNAKGGVHYRLPTEAEWEYACRNQGQEIEYSDSSALKVQPVEVDVPVVRPTDTWMARVGSEIFPNREDGEKNGGATAQNPDANPNLGRGIHPVGSVWPSSGLGLNDMSSNVWEWVEDIYDKDAYAVHADLDPLFIGGVRYQFGASRVLRVERGGSWDRGADSRSRCSLRGKDYPEVRGFFLGFRVVREVQ
ncbi:MAG: SUMF1/EgtB/PvdO family nonheme iron enzyme [Magnetococcus sp. DMHC-6]